MSIEKKSSQTQPVPQGATQTQTSKASASVSSSPTASGNAAAVSPQPATTQATQVAPQKGHLKDVAKALLMFQKKEIKVDHQQLQQMSAEIQAEAQAEVQEEPEKLIGILGLCAIRGHDVHFLSEDLEIDHHVKIGEKLDERLEEARQQLLSRRSQLAAIFVFTKSFKYLTLNGVLKDD